MKGMAIKVLLVEDDRALREALADTLMLAGHDFKAVGSAEDALAAVAVEAFNLVISDVNMPGMDGHQLLGLLRARQPQLPVLLMTAHGAVERAVDAMRQGAADYLVKPFWIWSRVMRWAISVRPRAKVRLRSNRPVHNCWSWPPEWRAAIPRY
jgi:two-component system response regulator FlrC